MKAFQWLKRRFNHEINPYTVSCKAVFRNVDKTLVMYVRSDVPTLVTGLKASERKLNSVARTTDREKLNEAALYFARAIFQDEGERLVEFYDNPAATISALGMFFDKQLKQKITEAQKA